MKKGEQPRLDAKWWSRNKAKTLGKTGVGAALKEYEVALDLLDEQRQLKALNALTPFVTKAYKKCHKIHHAETREALGRLRVLSLKRSNEVKRKLQRGVGAVPPQKHGKKVVIWRRDIAEEVMKVYKAPYLKEFKGYNVELELNDDILDVLDKEKDHATPAFMVEDAQKECKATVASIVKLFNRLDVLREEYKDPSKLIAKCKKEVEAEIRTLARRVEKIPQKRWDKFTARKVQYKKYRVQCGCKVVLSGCSLALSGLSVTGGVASLFAPGGQAVAISSLVLSIGGALKSISSSIQLADSLGKEAESVQKSLRKDLDKLKASYLKVNNEAKKGIGGKEVFKTTLNTLLTVSIAPTIPNCDRDFKLWSNKVAGLEVSGRKLSKQFIVLLKDVDTLENKMRRVKGKEVGKVLDKVRKLRKHVSKAFDKAADMNARVNKADDAMPKVEALLKALKAKNPNYARIFDTIFPPAVDLVTALVGASLDFVGAAGKPLEVVNTAIVLADDIGMIVAEKLVDEV